MWRPTWPSWSPTWRSSSSAGLRRGPAPDVWRARPSRTASRSRASTRQPGDRGGDDVGAAQVADDACLHAVHHVAHDPLRVLVDDDEGPAVAAPITGARAERHLGRIAQAGAHAHALGHTEHLVDALRLHL